MAHGAPDWLRLVEVAVEVNLVPQQPVPAKEQAAGGIGRYTGISTTYQTVVSWTVAASKVGELKELILMSNDFTLTLFQVTIGDVVYCSDTVVRNVLPLVFADLKLEAAKVVKIECKSSDGSSITVDGVIVGKEIG